MLRSTLKMMKQAAKGFTLNGECVCHVYAQHTPSLTSAHHPPDTTCLHADALAFSSRSLLPNSPPTHLHTAQPAAVEMFTFNSPKVVQQWHVFTDAYFGGRSHAAFEYNEAEQVCACVSG